VDWSTIRPGLVSLIASLASDDMTVPLVDGTVTWFGAAVPFIAPETQAGIYLRTTAHAKSGRPGTVYKTIGTGAAQKVQATRTRQEKFTLQIQAKSLETTDTTCAQVWIDRITDNIWDSSVLSYLKRLGLAIIKIEPTVNFESTSQHSEVIDSHETSVVSVDIHLQAVSEVLGLPVDFIQHVGISGAITGSTDDPITVPEFVV
jgi:hypothetical protein